MPKVVILPLDGGEPSRVLELPPESFEPLRWTPDGRATVSVSASGGAENVWKVPHEGGPPI